MKQVSFAHFIGKENYLCSYCAGIIGKLPELGINLPAGIIYEDMEGKVSYLHPHCALRFSAQLNGAVVVFLEKKPADKVTGRMLEKMFKGK